MNSDRSASETVSIDHDKPAPTTLRQTRTMKFRVKDYTPAEKDKELREALLKWRQTEYDARFKGEMFLGPSLVMPTAILNRIVDVAHFGMDRLSTLQQLCEQTDWNENIASLYWEQIYSIITSICSVPATAETSNNETSVLSSRSMNNEKAAPAKRRRYNCGACGQEGHICKLDFCLLLPI